MSLYLKGRKKYIIRSVDKKPSPLCLVISFRCLDPSSIMAIVLISAPSQSRLLLHTQGGIKVSGTKNKMEFSTEEPLHRTWLLCRCDTIFPWGTCQQSYLKEHFLPTLVAFSKVCYKGSACSCIHCPYCFRILLSQNHQSKPVC